MYWKKEINWQAYRIGNWNEARQRINERWTDSVNISPDGTGPAAFTKKKTPISSHRLYKYNVININKIFSCKNIQATNLKFKSKKNTKKLYLEEDSEAMAGTPDRVDRDCHHQSNEKVLAAAENNCTAP